MIIRKPITYALAHEKLSYCPETGVFVWKGNRMSARNGKQAGSISKTGYLEVRIGERLIQCHRLAWLMHYGELPPKGMVIDHINRVKTDNRIANLRCVTQSINMANTVGRHYRGVCFCKQTGLWKATASSNGRQVWLGRFASKDDALAARISAERRIYPIEVPRA